MRECQYFLKYDSDSSYNSKAYNAFDLIKSAISNKQIEMLDVERCKVTIDEVMQYLSLKKRYLHLASVAGDKLTIKEEGFVFYDSTFSTLDEVERAMKLKAFL